jgi:hypothetical protein
LSISDTIEGGRQSVPMRGNAVTAPVGAPLGSRRGEGENDEGDKHDRASPRFRNEGCRETVIVFQPR